MLPLRPTTSERGECHDSTRSSKDPTGHEVFNKPVWTILILTKLVDLPFANFVEALASYLLSFDDPPLPPSPLKASPCSAQGKALKIETDIKKSSPVSPHWRPGSPHRRRVVFVDARFQPYFERFHIKNENSKLAQVQDRIKYWNPEFCATCYENIDLILTMGGDGTVLYTSWLFQRCSVPPLMPFYFGSLGFLTDFKISNIKKHLKPLLLHSIHPETKEPCTQSKLTINKRMRLSVTVYRAPRKGRLSINVLKSDIYNDMQQSNIWTEFPEEIHPLLSPIGDRAISASSQHSMEAKMEAKERRASMVDALVDDLCLRTRAGSLSSIPPHLDSLATPSRSAHQLLTDKGAPVPTENFHVLNEVVVDRGPSAYMSQLDLFVDGKPLTAVQADGLVLSTPTGSTAYSLSAGGSLVHPGAPCILVTPICPHSLSFRPMILPDTVDLKIQIPKDSRSPVWASFDGKHRVELQRGDYIVVTRSMHPVLTLSSSDISNDWFQSLGRCLHWNERTRQKSLDQTEEAININKITENLLEED